MSLCAVILKYLIDLTNPLQYIQRAIITDKTLKQFFLINKQKFKNAIVIYTFKFIQTVAVTDG